MAPSSSILDFSTNCFPYLSVWSTPTPFEAKLRHHLLQEAFLIPHGKVGGGAIQSLYFPFSALLTAGRGLSAPAPAPSRKALGSPAGTVSQVQSSGLPKLTLSDYLVIAMWLPLQGVRPSSG